MSINNKNSNVFYSEKAVEMRKRLTEMNGQLEEMSYNLVMKQREFNALRSEYEELIGIKKEEKPNA